MNKVSEDIFYVGVNDHEVDLFEGMYKVPNGVSYNSYVIADEKIAVLDSVDAHFGKHWLVNIENVLGERTPDYIVVSHMEPDHSANVFAFTEKYPSAKIIGNAKTFVMLEEFFGTDFAEKRVVVKEGDVLELGKHSLKFVFAPMVHWPEVMFAYDEYEKVLFSADAFGKFGALDVDDNWDDEARRYYFGIVGKYGVQVQSVLKKLAVYDIRTICPLHGPVLKENLAHYLDLYSKWSTYSPEVDGVMIAYTSVYGNTKQAAQMLANHLKTRGVENVTVCDLARSDFSICVSEAFMFNKLVLATTTYNGELFPAMRQFIDNLVERNYQGRTIGIIENGSWAPVAAKCIKTRFEKCKNLTFTENSVKIRSALNAESLSQLSALADELSK